MADVQQKETTMKILTIIYPLVCAWLITNYASAQNQDSALINPSAKPTPLHKAMIARKYGMFIHFGINTFHDQEWTDGTKSALSYKPTAIDTDNWAKTAQEAGMKYVILVCKHHEGFALWDSKHTEYDVGTSPSKTDVVAAMAKSCKKHGIELGLYYSLWDRNWGEGVMRLRRPKRMSPEDSMAYREYMRGQLTELLENYGPICELWLDGGWVQPRDVWGIDELYTLTKKLQPDCAFGVNWSIGRPDNPDAHPVLPKDQREGFPIRYFPSDFRLGDPHLPTAPDPKLFSHKGKLYYMPFESTVCLNGKWFYNTKDKKLKSIERLAALYKQATAQDNILILNSPPNRDGVMPEHNVERLKDLAVHLGLLKSKENPNNSEQSNR